MSRLARLALAARLARREMRGGLRGFAVFLACLALGVAAIAAVGSVRAAIGAGLAAQGQVLLGGDARITATYRAATEAEADWIARHARAVSEVVEFRSMAVVPGAPGQPAERALTQVKAVDGAYPLAGTVRLDPPMPLDAAFAARDGRHGLAMDPVLIARLGLALGDTVRLGLADYELRAALIAEPDRVGGGMSLGPRTLLSREGLAGSGLIAPGTLYETEYRLLLPEGAAPDRLAADLAAAFPEAGLRWRDRRNAAPGVERFVGRVGDFLVLVGLAALAVGGVGVAAAVRNHLAARVATIATLRSLGASGGDVFALYLIQIGAIAALGVLLGLALGTGLPWALGPLLAADLPVPAVFGFYPGPVAQAALFGLLTALLFALWPLARARAVPAAALFREVAAPARRWPGWPDLAAMALVAAALAGALLAFSGAPVLAGAAAGGLLLAAGVLWLAAHGAAALARRLSRARALAGRPGLRLALGAIGAPGAGTAGTVVSLGLGLAVLAAIAQVDHGLRALIDRELPDRAPAFFLIDIQNDQLAPIADRLAEVAPAAGVETAPMLRGVITRLHGVPAAQARIDPAAAWILRGDRGVSYAAEPPPGTVLTAGQWWPADHSGPPLVSFSARHAAELGLGVGDSVTVSVLGREIEARIASLREVEFRDLGINFLMIFDPGSFAGAPHTHIATVHAPPEAEAAILRDVAGAFPNVTAIGVREAIGQVAQGLDRLGAAAGMAAAVTLAAGLLVLLGTAAAEERRRRYEAAVLRVLGAARGRILAAFALRAALAGALAGTLALGLGAAAGWAVMRFAIDGPAGFEPVSALAIVFGGALLSLAAGLGFALRSLRARPAAVLRSRD